MTVSRAKQLGLAMVLVVMVSATAVHVSAAPPSVATCEELQSVSSNITYVLESDIDCGATINWNGGAGFQPLGTGATNFQASIDGNGYTVKNLHINRPTTDNVGLYAQASGVSISNLRFENLQVTGQHAVGGVGGSLNNATINNVHVSGTIRGKDKVGGLVGSLTGTATVGTVIVDGAVSSSGHTGGIVGNITASGLSTISNVINTATVSADDTNQTAGGIVGNATDATVQYALNNGPVTGTTNTGGIIGLAAAGSRVEHVVSVGAVTASSGNRGGIAGTVDSAVPVTNVYWSTADTNQTVAAGQNLGSVSANAVANKAVFYNTTGQAPLNAWNFSTTWLTWPDSLPLLRGFSYLDITTKTLPNGQAGGLYPTAAVVPAGSHGPVSFRVASGALPAGLQLDEATGKIQGTATTAGSYNFSITVQDRLTSETQAYNLTIASPPGTPAPASGNNSGGQPAPSAPEQYSSPTGSNKAVNTIQRASGAKPSQTYNADTLQRSIPPVAISSKDKTVTQPAVLGQQTTQPAPVIINAQHIYEASLPSFGDRIAKAVATWWLPVVGLSAFLGYTLLRRRPAPAMQFEQQAIQQDEQLQQLVEQAQAATIDDFANDTSEASDNSLKDDDRYLQ